ncbi:SusC/RagA family TonB-linked outer membrane protein [Sinomicrobium weinanense]|uniref:SusC/RagA family TonB-linked outer membrane protein n=1 Tax=Sinomicrobium weinanense TaxID=2842200 RepID=A0A926JSV7_9FLAO|nr:SusC/RagA family TonB-linked outer membrane protein [Sinomicrobium weinanense]MBC9796873.1 SusC/RagA family TonB-linked outer membrane protein [Sinomicrobium weinanense]MBU3123876.1 SusC/RagA family TonB-linked outer membrane protein [Sinomicrobium weinanense]
MKRFLVMSLCLLFVSAYGYGQERMVTGTVTSNMDKAPLPGVNILIVGGSVGAVTDFDGNYSIQVSEGQQLQFSYIGFVTRTVTVGTESVINIELEEDTSRLDEVVVTALGISREKKALTYAAQEVKGDELTKVKQTNPINSLSGKSAGVTITRSSSGLGGAAKVVLRGNSSTSNNDPLYVIDGVPMLNSGNGSNGEEPGTDIYGGQTGNRDGGDAMSMINPDDIESMTVLKGASASALYGSQGANGVILITTKKGKEGALAVNFNTSFTVDNVMSLPKLQSEYQSPSAGQPIGENGRVSNPKSWGAKADGLSNDPKDFFKTGYTSINSLSLTAGNKKAQTYFSYATTVAGGVIPENRLTRNNLTLRETAKFLDDKIDVSASVNLSDQRIWNRPTNGLYSNPLTGVYLHPVGIDRNIYKNKFEYFNPEINMMDQYASSFDENIQQNPYWLIHRNPSKDIAQRVLANVSVKYQVTDAFSIKSRGSFDKSFFTFDKRIYAGSDLALSAENGRYIFEKTENTQQYVDFIASFSKDVSEDFSLTALLGTSLTKYKIGDRIFIDSGRDGIGLNFPNVFTLANIATTNNMKQTVENREVQSVFGSANLAYKRMLYLDVTGRTDWSSTLAMTNSYSFFYPSVGLTGVLSEMFTMPEAITFAKVRASYAEVGKDIPPYATIPLNSISDTGPNVGSPVFAPIEGETLKPERQKSFELGTEWRFFQGRLGLDFTYYDTRTTDQIFFIQAEPNPSGYSQNIVNAGEISNKGFEIVLNGKPIANDKVTWNTALNFARNDNEVISVHPSLQNGEAIITERGVNGYEYALIEGEDFGSIKARSLIRDENGMPVISPSGTLLFTDFETVAHAQPDFTLGWNNSLEIGDFTVNLLIDGKFGGDVLSVTEAINDFYGVSRASAKARNTNGGMINVVNENGEASQITAQEYYTAIGGRAGMLGEYVYDATNISLRELSIGYGLTLKDSFIQKINFSLIANNLFFIYKDAPFDPNVAASTGLGLQGVDIYNQPSTRSIGLNLNVNF